MFASLPLPALVARARALYTNAGTTEVTRRLIPFGYGAPDLDDGLDLVEEVAALAAAPRVEYTGPCPAAAALAALEARFVRHRRQARLAHRRTSEGYRALDLAGATPQGEERLIRAADAFYGALARHPRFGAGICGLDAAAVAEGLARVEAARMAAERRGGEAGEEGRATRLRAQAAELAAVASVALEDLPQTCARLGLAS